MIRLAMVLAMTGGMAMAQDDGGMPDPELIAMVEWASATCGADRLPQSILLGAGLVRSRVTDADLDAARDRFDAAVRDKFGDDDAAACDALIGMMTAAG